MPSDRAGYTVAVYAIDVSPSMAGSSVDGEKEKGKSKLDLVKEYCCRALEPKVSSIMLYRV
jgi:ATP-dependent DNA helicase 2 subunit 2